MLSAAALAIVAVTIIATSFLSGIFGMAGGLILLGVLLFYLDVAPAMVLFGAIQTTANGWRALLWRRYVRWPVIWRYAIGSAAMFLVMRSVAFLPDKAMMYLGLGLIPFAVDLLPKRFAPDITKSGMPYVCGAVIILLQLLAGATGHVLDQFFNRSELDRRTIVATKAATQVVAHLYRIAYFGSFADAFDVTLPWWAYVAGIALSITGTSLAALALSRMTDASFRLWSRRIVLVVSLGFLARGIWLLAEG